MSGTLHPDIAALLAGILKPADPAVQPALEAVRAANQRLADLLGGPGEAVAQVWDGMVETRHGSVPVRWYSPAGGEEKVLAFVHGGGFMAGTIASYDTFCRALALRTGHGVVSVAYSLSPEAVYPRALEEVVDVFGVVRPHAVSGDSAGGCLAAAALHVLAGLGGWMPASAVLIYPMVDAGMGSASIREFGSGYSFTADRAKACWECYLGRAVDAAAVEDGAFSPSGSAELGRFPRTMVIVAEFDPLVDEGREFAGKLRAAGVEVELVEAGGMIHGFLKFRAVVGEPDRVMERIGAFLN